jgi:hypothetical protein
MSSAYVGILWQAAISQRILLLSGAVFLSSFWHYSIYQTSSFHKKEKLK